MQQPLPVYQRAQACPQGDPKGDKASSTEKPQDRHLAGVEEGQPVLPEDLHSIQRCSTMYCHRMSQVT